MEAADLDVLVVDDHEAMRTLLVRILAKAGVHRVRSAENGLEALDTLRQRTADLILADNQMPGMSGIEFLAAVRSDPALGAPKIVIVSGNTGAAFAMEAVNAGANDVLAKPVLLADLLTAINRLFAI
ncbi:MAG: response regulator [Hyphomonadaceae bacterium]